ncbi:TatD family hydrolase [Candidatus Saccharibacteria bacterium]|nr:TatD family hydrolase [Candidatus Saccharibacteria bacterium]
MDYNSSISVAGPERSANYLIDSHCHIHNTKDFDSTPEEIIARANQNGIKQMIVIGTSHEDSLAAKNFAETHDNIFWSYGIHPSEAGDWASEIADLPISGSVAIGEVGLDYHYQPYDRAAQIRLFEEMLALAQKHNLPLIFHIREAFDDFFPIVDNQHIKNAVVHSFSDSQINLEKALDRGYYIGVNGLATFANIPLPPVERMLLETDAPYLTPKPFRGKINESAYIKHIAEYLAFKLNIPLEKITEETTKNVQVLFQLPQPILRPA